MSVIKGKDILNWTISMAKLEEAILNKLDILSTSSTYQENAILTSDLLIVNGSVQINGDVYPGSNGQYNFGKPTLKWKIIQCSTIGQVGYPISTLYTNQIGELNESVPNAIINNVFTHVDGYGSIGKADARYNNVYSINLGAANKPIENLYVTNINGQPASTFALPLSASIDNNKISLLEERILKLEQIIEELSKK